MADMPDFGKKIGPLPAGAWAVIVVAGLGIGYFINNRSAKKNAGPTEQQLTETGVGVGGGKFLPIDPPSDTGDDDKLPETNQSWGNKAITWLIAQSFDGVVANNAVNKFLTGQTLSAQESALIAMVLAHFGPPPDGTSAPPDNPLPATPGNLTVTATVGDRVNLSWSPVIGASSYEVSWSTAEYGEGGPQQTSLPTISSPGHAGGYDHIFFVRAVNEFGKSEPASINVPHWDGKGSNPPPSNPPPSNPPPSSPPPQPRTYTIHTGDTLTGISVRFYGTASRYVNIYNANAGAIEGAAKAHGKTSSRGPNGTVGWWIYPGTVLQIP